MIEAFLAARSLRKNSVSDLDHFYLGNLASLLGGLALLIFLPWAIASDR